MWNCEIIACEEYVHVVVSDLADREGKNKCLENVINKEALNIK